MKVNCKQRFYSLRCRPGEGQAVWAKALVLGAVGHLGFSLGVGGREALGGHGVERKEAGLP